MIESPAGTSRAEGATWDGRGTHFAVWSEAASALELCLFDGGGEREVGRVALRRGSDGVWHAYLAGVAPGQRYGYRAHGPYAPERGQRFNPMKLLLDPCAQAIDRPARWHELLAGYDPSDPGGSRPDTRDSAPVAPRSVVVDPGFDWGDDAPPRTPWSESVIYECHVKGLTALHSGVAAGRRGTFAGLASEPVIDHLLALGVTAVELMPVQHAYSERFLVERGLANYWGYNPVGWFAPDVRFAAGGAGGDAVGEFKRMVRALHRAGLEVILDVVYNHSGEADELGPTLCLRGLGNDAYYRLDERDPRRYVDVTGCGNTLNLEHPRTLDWVIRSLHHWVEQMHVDGFRFDLAPALARGPGGVDPTRGLFARLQSDPVLSAVKLIAEPWDLGPDGWQLGRFPKGWVEWNDRYRDGVRRFWRGDAGRLGDLATRIAGSSDAFGHRARTPQASLNYVACHDGLTLRDLTSYEHRHNDANGFDGRDGAEDDANHNWGVEGESDRDDVVALRDRVARSMLATLALSLGVPMLLQGDEMGRSQGGNNNAYGQDNATSWVRWELAPRERALLEHARRCLALRRQLGVFRRTEHFRGEPAADGRRKDVSWLRPDGGEMKAEDWRDPERRALGMWVCGHGPDGRPAPEWPESLLLVNASPEPVPFALPRSQGREGWRLLLDTSAEERAVPARGETAIAVAAHAACLLVRTDPAGASA